MLCANKICMRTRVFITFSLAFLITVFAFTQKNVQVNIQWKPPVESQDRKFLFFDNAGYNNEGFPVYGDYFSNEFIDKAGLTDVITTPLPAEWKDIITSTHSITDEFKISITNKVANSGNYSVYEIFPFRLKDGVIEILISANVKLDMRPSEVVVHANEKSASNSVLSTGNWVRVGITQNGLYRVNYSQLNSVGLLGGSVSSNNIQLYGNGGGTLPEENYKFRYDDLFENAIEVVDGGDGSFDNGDYILFYGQGPHQWFFNWTDTNSYYHQYNVYADTNYYFITVGSTNGLRLTDRASLGGTASYSTNTADGYTFKEDDLVSLTHSGRQWMGDYFNFYNSYTYNFNLENINTSEPARVYAKVASRCVLCPTTVQVSHNGSNFITLNPPQASSSYTAPYATTGTGTGTINFSGSNVDLTVTKTGSGELWLDYLEINYRKFITAGSGYSVFSDKYSIGESNAEFVVSNTNANQEIWDVTNPLVPIRQLFSIAGSDGRFQVNMDTIRTFVVFDPAGAGNVASVEQVANQNLHALTETNPPADFIIITPTAFLSAAQDLANFHTTHDNMVVHVVTLPQIYNEFSSGKQDIAAIRDFIKMYYDKNPADYPPYVLLFGDGSYDYKPYLNRLDYENTNMVPAFETIESFDRGGGSYCSDDFYALLDNNEGTTGYINLSAASNPDIGVGRIPVRTLNEAQGVVNKIKHYATNIDCMRDWRNVVTVVADDMEAGWEGQFFNGSENIADQIEGINPVWNMDKIYLDSYQQVSNAGQRYPEAETALYDRINKGSLIINYIGHGGETGMAAERVVQIDDFVSLVNKNSLPAFATATCTFTRFDNPAFNSAGEYLIQEPDKGAIGLFSTIRPISIVNLWNQKFYDAAFTRLPNGEMPRMGDIIRLSKQASPTHDWGEYNILLFGDPALRLAYPQITVVTDSINGMWADTTAGSVTDTLMASQLVTISGHIEDLSGMPQTGFNGDLYTTVFDKTSQLTTLGNDGGNQFNYELRKNVIFKGKTTITDGYFKFQFVVPLDINYLIGEGKISYYATDNDKTDAHGYYFNFDIGGSEDNCSADGEGPDVEVFINDTNFVEMGITQAATSILVVASDENGINTTGLGIGHDLQVILDGDVQNPIVLNDYYVADNNSYTTGRAKYLITGLEEGFHTIEVQVWDGCNNQSNATLNFAVTNSEPALINMLAYPNPFSDNVTLAFEHNFQGKNVTATVDILSLAGQTVKNFTKTYVPEGNREVSINWDGRSEGGEKMASGLYICRVMLEDDQGNRASGCCKVVLVY